MREPAMRAKPYALPIALIGLFALMALSFGVGELASQQLGSVIFFGTVAASAFIAVMLWIIDFVDARTADLAAQRSELRKTVAQISLITQHSRDMVARIGPDGTVRYISPALQRLLGLPPSAIDHDYLLSLVHPDDVPAVAARQARLFAGTVAGETLAHRVNRPDGRLIWVESIAKSLHDESTGAPDGFVTTVRDVTERRQLERSQLQAQKREAIGHIASRVAHDFNNILQSVIGGLELTLDSIGPEEPGREFAEVALESAKRGSYVTHHLLSYSRRQVLQPRLLDLRPFLADFQQLVARMLGPHIVVQNDVASDIPPVRVDPNQLQVALFNLAINAADAMQEGGTLTIGAAPHGAEPGEPLVAVRITDNGTGMDTDTLAQACEPFFSTKGAEGTGLGLSMAQGFAEQSGGRLQIESKLGYGTTVALLFHAAAGVIAPAPDLAIRPQPSRRVLVVDDEPDVLLIAGAFLERAGLWIVRVSSAHEALTLLAGDLPFDALVTDYAMPGMNGVDLTTRAQAIRAGLPALIITGFAEVRGIGQLPNNVRVLHKPFVRNDLLKALHQVMLVGDDPPAACVSLARCVNGGG